MTLSQLTPGSCFRVAGANSALEILSIRVGDHASRIRVRNVGTDADTVRTLIGRDTIHEYTWANDTVIYPVRTTRR
jgi:hypothetical protein